MILMIYKLYVYKSISRVTGTLNFNTLLYQLVKVKNLEKGAAFKNSQKHDYILKKMFIVENLLSQ